MGDTKTTLTWLLRDQVSGTAAKLDKTLQHAAHTGTGAKGVFSGLGSAIGSMINPTTLAIAGIGALTAGVGLALNKAVEHDVVLRRLDQTLKQNVKSFDGNRAAIDQYIDKQTDMGFTVSETTGSLAQLVTATHDVQLAENAQQTAMDLARLKGISLGEATDALTMIEGGRFKGLAKLGIVLHKGATVTEALMAVQKVAKGQNEAYSQSVSGGMAKINAKFDEAVTKIGQKLLPILTKLAGFFADVVIPAILAVVNAIAQLVGWIIKAYNWLNTLTKGTAAYKKEQATLGLTAPNGGFIPYRAAGGPVEAGHPYIVGERGPEMLVMGKQSGTVIPNGAAASSSEGVYIKGISKRELARMVDQEMYFTLQRAAPTLGRT